MRTRLLPFMLFAALMPAVLAQAEPTFNIRDIFRALGPAATVPPEWDGIWQTTDSVFTCTGGLQVASTGSDTLCGGKEIPSPGGINYTCTGTADATTIHMTCTYGFDPIPDCHSSSEMVIDGTRTGDAFYQIVTSNTTYSGTGFGCNLIPPQCSITHIRGTRTGPAPSDYCATATLPTTWGKIKAIYR